MVDFGGFWMPVSYGSIIEEHKTVRSNVGIFDVSHMGEFIVTGAGAKEFVNRIITNNCSRMEPGALQYTAMCRENGTVVDDLLVFVLDEDKIMLVVNASNIDKDFEHIDRFDHPGVDIRNASDEYALIATQGPSVRETLTSCALFDGVKKELEETPYYKGFRFEHGGREIIVSRTGYTGELGFEIFVPSDLGALFWHEITAAGEAHGIAPIGLGARDTLRFEASFCLYGHELDDETSPLEAGLGWVVKLKKDDFCGRDALRTEKIEGPRRVLRGFELEGRNIARQGYAVLRYGKEVGKVTSGAFAPSFSKSLCMASIERAGDDDDVQYSVQIRGKSVLAKKTPLPFYKGRAR
jgi:aminomethyltransferase